MASFRKFISISIYAIPLKIFSFFTLGYASYISFLNVFFVSIGLSKFRAGIITGFTYAPPILAGPLWGYLADYSGRRRLILMVLCVGAASTLFSLPWVAKAIYPTSKFECGNRNSSNLTFSSLGPTGPPASNYLLPVTQRTALKFENNSLVECEKLRDEAEDTLFWVLLVIMLVGSVFIVPLLAYAEAIIMRAVMSAPSETSYGAQRIFGSIGLSIVTYAAGKAASEFSMVDVSQYSAAIFIIILCVLLMIPVGWCIPDGIPIVPNDEGNAETTDIDNRTHIKQILHLCFSVDVMLFLGTVLVHGLANSIFLNFSFLYVTETLNVKKSDMTYVIVTATVSEAIMFPFTAKVIKLLRGTMPTIFIGCVAHVIRFLVMSYDISFDLLVGLQTLSALGFALPFAAMMEHCHTISPEPIRVSMSTIMITLFFIVSTFIANIAGGRIYELHGGKMLFFGLALLCGVWSIVIFIHYGSKHVQQCCRPRDYINVAVPTSSRVVNDNEATYENTKFDQY